MNNVFAFVLAIVLGIASADIPATQTDMEYVFGPLEIVDSLDEDEEIVEPYVYIEVAEPDGTIYFGDTITLRCVLVGLNPAKFVVTWQYCTDIELEDYVDIDCHDFVYSFVASYENVGYYYRVVVKPINIFDARDFGGFSMYTQ